jgi:glutathione synthase/RimK-type ligase-like ATP-grasp enzyme
MVEQRPARRHWTAMGEPGVERPDLVFFVTPPWRATRAGDAGDYLDTERFRARFPDLAVSVVHFNDPSSEVTVIDGRTVLHQADCGTIELSAAHAFVYFPYSFEAEDLALRPPNRGQSDGPWEHRQWRAVMAWLEHAMPGWGRCLNDPVRARAASNKLIQMAAFRLPLAVPPTWIGNDASAAAFLDGRRVVAKNLSEGTFTGELVGEGRILLARPATAADGAPRPAPVILQERIDAAVELRTYVIGERVLTLEVSRGRTDEATPDVRSRGLRAEDVRLSDAWHRFDADLVACARRLELGYAVFDIIPVGETLYVLEVNANGVWTGTWAEAGATVRDALHEYIAGLAGVA